MASGDRYNLEEHVPHLVSATRSIGLEHGIDLLLQLLYLRWDVELESRAGAWRRLSSALLRTRNPGAVLGRALSERAPYPAPPHVAVDEDGGQALRVLVDELARFRPRSGGPDAFRDEIHRAFEAVLQIRSRWLSKAGMESETPRSIAKLMARLGPSAGLALDPACGIGNALYEAFRLSRRRRLIGYELNEATAARTAMRFSLADIPLVLRVGNGLGDIPETVSTVLVQPPWGLRLGDEEWRALPDLRFGKPGRASADFIWLQSAQAAAREGGRAIALMPQGTLTRGHSEGEIRGAMLRAGLIEAIVVLPANLLSSTAIPSCIWILRGGFEPDIERSGSVLFIDASELVDSDSAHPEVRLTDQGIEQIVDAVRQVRDGGQRVDLPGHVARVAAAHEIDASAVWPGRYLDERPQDRLHRPRPARRLLTELRVENFKSIGSLQRVDLAPLTLVYGPNSAGKSSLLQSLLLLKQSLSADSLVTQGAFADAGSFPGALHRHDLDRVLTLGVTYGAADSWVIPEGVPDPALMRRVDFTFEADASGLPQQRTAALAFGEFSITLSSSGSEDSQTPKTFTLELDSAEPVFLGIAEGTLLFPFDSRRSDRGNDQDELRRLRGRQQNAKRALRIARQAGVDLLSISADGLLPSSTVDLDRVTARLGGLPDREVGIVTSYMRRAAQLAAGVSEEMRRLMTELSYLGPLRSPPQRFYNRGAASVGAGTAGEHVALYLFDNSSEVAKVNDWLQALDVPYELRLVPVIASGSTSVVGDLVAIVLTDTRSGVDVSPSDVGFGVSQLLPIVVELLARQESVVCIEQPEIHLHPRLQAQLGDLLLEATVEGRSNQVLVETHSEHLLLRIQRRIREGACDPDQVSVVYVDSQADGAATVERLRLDEQGGFIDEWPNGFFDERLTELFG